MSMPNWLLPLLALIAIIGFIGFAFRQGTKVKPSGDAHGEHDGWTGGDGTHHGTDGGGHH